MDFTVLRGKKSPGGKCVGRPNRVGQVTQSWYCHPTVIPAVHGELRLLVDWPKLDETFVAVVGIKLGLRYAEQPNLQILPSFPSWQKGRLDLTCVLSYPIVEFKAESGGNVAALIQSQGQI
ncbi:unnamed protein product [Protopolystoma xenopodis]|uniref:Uncharacterized protein n=1 Tax=Protopolystoma xenopodis TaxID=117903 RepID=A0A448WGE3_9PLAT|nr:unnamed protein product [Protopolystoma xenopodis]